jgi:hypothetical protein
VLALLFGQFWVRDVACLVLKKHSSWIDQKRPKNVSIPVAID